MKNEIKMKKRSSKYLFRSIHFISAIVLLGIIFHSCEDFLHPDQELITEQEDMYTDWSMYRSAELGLYSLQQNLVEQLVVLGELRGDLLKVTEHATPDLIDVYNFEVRKDNPYASPVNFYKLIAASNNLIRQLETAHPEVLDKTEPINNYDRLYGEALCMRAWAYFNAVRIYGKVPYVHQSLSTVEEIEDYVNSSAEFMDSTYIRYDMNGFDNDTIRDTVIILDRFFLDERAVIDTFTYQLENKVKAVGVNHHINNGDITWTATVWNDYARHVLLGQMYLFAGDYSLAMEHFRPILYNYTSEGSYIKFGLDRKYARDNWKNIFSTIDPFEHIYTIWFGKSYQQQNKLQILFSVIPPNEYMMKPTKKCIQNWESMWNDPEIIVNEDYPSKTRMKEPGIPGDFHRGYGVSYKYYRNGEELTTDTVAAMLLNKMKGNQVGVQLLMSDVDTVVHKYSISKSIFDHDAHFIVYRAAGVHLYAAEIYAYWEFIYGGLEVPRTQTNTSLKILNDGSYNSDFANFRENQLGVRGRVGFADGYEAIRLQDIIYKHDPVTNNIIGYHNFYRQPEKQRDYLVERIMEEKARELAFEGERFYDLMRIARRHNDPAFLADRVAAKFEGSQKQAIREKLMNEENWYINYYSEE
jgi:hypothetical protein